MRLSVVIITTCLIAGFIFLGIWILARSWFTLTNPNQKLFTKGIIPTPAPHGFYKGTTDDYKGNWLGKKFDASTQTGINVFLENNQQVTKYPFKTYTGKGLQDTEIKVLKIDYNVTQNPLWLRFIKDEIVEIAPGYYLGKLHIDLIPGFPFTLGYFRLEKE